MRLAAFAICVALAGCGSLGTSDPDALAKGMITACQGAATAENAIAAYIRSGTIKPVTFPAIDHARVTIKGFCDPAAALPSDLLGAASQVIAATSALLAFKPAGAP